MKPALISAFLTLLGLVAASPISPAPGQSRGLSSDAAKPAACSVSGVVVKLQGSLPLPSSTVRLQSVDDHTRTFSGMTDAGGRFEIRGIDAGRYRLRVIRNGYITQEYGQRTPNDPGTILALSAGQDLKDLVFRLQPSAVITGRIQNENGDPLPWVRVTALRASYSRGKRTLSSEVTVVTNDLGEYRVFGLRPGRYFLSAVYKPGQRLEPMEENDEAEDAGKFGYVQTYFPGTPDPARATALTIKTGDEISSMDISLEPTTSYSIRGRVSYNVSKRNAANIILSLEPRTTGLGWSVPPRQSIVDKPDGAFEITGVLPGSYTITALVFDEGKRSQARQTVDITNIDAEGIQLTPLSGMDVRGQVLWDPKPSVDQNGLRVFARSADTAFVYTAQFRVTPTETFLLHEMPEGLYRLTTSGETPDCYLKSIRYAGMEVSDDEFNVIRGTQATLEVTISTRGAQLQGTVKDADGLPAAGVWVVLVPGEPRRNEFHLFRQTISDAHGRFGIRGIAPGDYKIFSWEQVEPNSWEDPDFLKPLETKGQSISLQEGDGKSIELTAIRSASPEQEKQ